jgi:hypothetical protein
MPQCVGVCKPRSGGLGLVWWGAGVGRRGGAGRGGGRGGGGGGGGGQRARGRTLFPAARAPTQQNRTLLPIAFCPTHPRKGALAMIGADL